MVRSPRVSRVLPLALLFAATTLVAERQARPPQPPTPQSGAEGELAKINAELVAMQVALDRVHFSPGEIDGQAGDNTMRALAAFRAAHGVTAPRPTTETPVGTAGRSARGTKAGPAAPPAPVLDPATRDALAPSIDQPLTDYTIGEPDVAGPFTTVPADLMEQSKLDVLGYTSPLELLAERFHAAPALIRALNPDAQYVAGETLRVPNVDPMLLPTTQGPVAGKDNPNNPTVIEVSEADRLLRLRRGDELLLVAPVTVGSEHDPLPVGDWVVPTSSSTRSSTTTPSSSGTPIARTPRPALPPDRTTRSGRCGWTSTRNTSACTARRRPMRSGTRSRTAACG